MQRFRDRTEAGRQLAEALEGFRDTHPVVIALPRGGVVVGAEVARALDAPLDVLVARKIGAPFQPEYAIGAIAPEGVALLDGDAIALLGVKRDYIDRTIAEEREEMRRREALYREGRPAVEVRGRVAIVVDDGLATGFTAAAALAALRARAPAKLVFAAPVCAAGSTKRLERRADAIVCLLEPSQFRAVGEWYDDFGQTTDEEVVARLRAAAAR